MSKQPFSDDLPQQIPFGWWPVFNTTDLVIPAYAAMVFSGERSPYINSGSAASLGSQPYLESFGGQQVVRVKQADEAHLARPVAAQAASLWVNGPTPILPKRLGTGTRLWPANVLANRRVIPTFPYPNTGAAGQGGAIGCDLGFVAGKWHLSIPSSTSQSSDPSSPSYSSGAESVGPGIARFVAMEHPRSPDQGGGWIRPAFVDQAAGLMHYVDATANVVVTSGGATEADMTFTTGASSPNLGLDYGGILAATSGLVSLSDDFKTLTIQRAGTYFANLQFRCYTVFVSGTPVTSNDHFRSCVLFKNDTFYPSGIGLHTGFELHQFLTTASPSPISEYSGPGVRNASSLVPLLLAAGDRLRFQFRRGPSGTIDLTDQAMVSFVMYSVAPHPLEDPYL